MTSPDLVIPKYDRPIVSVELSIFGRGYEIQRIMRLIGAPGETPRINTVDIEIEDDDGARFTLRFNDDRAIAEFAMRLLEQVKPHLTEQR